MTIQNVTIGDIFKVRNSKIEAEVVDFYEKIFKVRNSKIEAEVVDFYEKKSIVTGEIIGYECIAQQINGMATNRFEVPFAQVVRNRMSKPELV